MDGASPSNFLSKGEEAVLHYKYKHCIFHFGCKQFATRLLYGCKSSPLGKIR
jgi:hypothetical protein